MPQVDIEPASRGYGKSSLTAGIEATQSVTTRGLGRSGLNPSGVRWQQVPDWVAALPKWPQSLDAELFFGVYSGGQGGRRQAVIRLSASATGLLVGRHADSAGFGSVL